MTPTRAKILVIDDERSICLTCSRILESEGYQVEYVTSGVEGVARAVRGDHDLVLLDLKMPDLSGLEALELIKRDRPEVMIIIITGYATIQTSIEAIKKGAHNYVPKPFTPEELTSAVTKALDDRQVRSGHDTLREELTRVQDRMKILGRSPAAEELKAQILKIAPTSFTVTVYGESGTGKELIAQAIHECSERVDRPFVAVDISALTPSLVQSELFGHVKGAFTGASSNRPGYFVIAHTGTLFLDEISNVSLELQGKLLRVLETRRVRPVGSEVEHEVDVRIVAATNRDLYQLVEQGRFREDLYYRLNVIPITVPPLRERQDDIPLLAGHFLDDARRSPSVRVHGFTTAAMARLIGYHWPGNVRELKNIVDRLAATVEAELIGVEHLPPAIAGRAALAEDLGIGEAPGTAKDLVEAKRRLKELVYEKVERQFVTAALERAEGNVTRAAELVGMARPNFHALMRKYGIHAVRSAPGGEPAPDGDEPDDGDRA
jgi:two-component system NtrC family response regulator